MDDENPVKYKISYLPLAMRDIEEITYYIVNTLEAPRAALSLRDSIDTAVKKLEEFPYMYRIYPFKKPMKYEYRKFQVKNYAVFYTVKNNIVEIQRVIYSRRDFEAVLD
jgi:plasmid stabilization system protein ParE